MPSYADIGKTIGELVERKQAAYGDAFGRAGEVFKILFPNGILADNYTEALAILRIIDKLFRIATKNDSFNEDPWQDIAGYAILMSKKIRDEQIKS